MAVKTYSFRYRPTTAPNGTEDRVLACSHTTDACHAVINSSGQIGYYVSGSFTQLGTKTQTIDNIWHSYIVEKDELGNGCIYVDGQKIGCATNFPIDNVNQIGNFKTELKPEIGRKPKAGLKPRGVSNIYTRPCCGDIDEIAYFDRQLSASEIVDLAQSGSLSKVYTLADYKITAMADDNIIATTEKPRYAENWRSIWDVDQRTTALPTAIGSITVNGSYKSLANAANSAGIWTPSTSGTAAYDYYQAIDNWRQMYFVSSGGGTGFLLTAQLGVDTDISAMSPTLEARQSALMYAEDTLRSAIMTQRQSNAETNAIDTMTEYADDLEAALRLQTDHALVFTTSATDPSTGWTAEEKLIHRGDYWRSSATAPWKTWSGTAWGTVDDAQAQAAATAAASAASTAQATANNAASAASEAQSTANTASSNATTALNTLSDIASDSKFSPVEKQSALNEWNIIASEKPANVSQATPFGISSTDYSNAFQALANYLNNGATWSSGTPAWLANLTITQTIVGTDFRAAWKLYYDKRTELLNAIATKAKTLADTAQATANVKRRVFTSTPTVPYDVGDLWVAGSTGDIKKCKTARATGSYTASEWEIASKYTDDTVAVTKSRTFIQTTDPSTGMQTGDYWLDSDDGHKPYVYRSGSWQVDTAMESAINAQTTADKKTTLWATLAVANSNGAITGDMFMDSSLIYRCLTSAPDITIANSTRITAKNFGNLASAPTGAIANDKYYNTTNLTWYRYTGSAWTADGEALNTVTVTYTPKYLGRYLATHPASYNSGDWWLVYDIDDSPLVRGFWYSNNGTPERVSTLSAEAQRKYKGVGLEDVLYASNNGYALLSGAYNPVAVYGVNTMDLLAVNQAFIKKLVSQSIEFENSISSIESDDFELGDNRVFMGRDSADVFSLLFQTLVGKSGTEKFWSNIYKLYGNPQNAIQEFRGNSYVDGGIFSGYGSVWSGYLPPPNLAFPHTISYGFVTRSATMGVAYVPLWGITIVRLNFNGNLNLFVSTDYGNTYPLNANKVFTVPIDIMVTCAKNYGNFLYVGTTSGLYMISSNVSVGSAVVTSKTSTISSEIISIQEFDGRLLVSSSSGTYTMPIDATPSTVPTLLNSGFVSCAIDADDSTSAWFSYGHVKNEGSMSTGAYVYMYSGASYSSIYIPGKPVKRLNGTTVEANTLTGIAVANNIVFLILYLGTKLCMVKSTDNCSTFQEIDTSNITRGLSFSILTCHNGILILRTTYGDTYSSVDLGNTWNTLSIGAFTILECRASYPMYTVKDGARQLYIACPSELYYTYKWTRDQKLGSSGIVESIPRGYIDNVKRLWDGRYFPSYASVDEVAPKKYFRFPAGTTHATIVGALLPLLKNNGQHVSCIGNYGVAEYPAIIRRDSSTIIRIFNTANIMIYEAAIGDSGTISSELQLEFIPVS